MGKFGAGNSAAYIACKSFRIVLRLITCCEALFCNSVKTVFLCCGVKAFTPGSSRQIEGGSCHIVTASGTIDYVIGLSATGET